MFLGHFYKETNILKLGVLAFLCSDFIIVNLQFNFSEAFPLLLHCSMSCVMQLVLCSGLVDRGAGRLSFCQCEMEILKFGKCYAQENFLFIVCAMDCWPKRVQYSDKLANEIAGLMKHMWHWTMPGSNKCLLSGELLPFLTF